MERQYSLLNKEGKWRERRDSHPRPPACQGNNHNAQPGLAGRFSRDRIPFAREINSYGALDVLCLNAALPYLKGETVKTKRLVAAAVLFAGARCAAQSSAPENPGIPKGMKHYFIGFLVKGPKYDAIMLADLSCVLPEYKRNGGQ